MAKRGGRDRARDKGRRARAGGDRPDRRQRLAKELGKLEKVARDGARRRGEAPAPARGRVGRGRPPACSMRGSRASSPDGRRRAPERRRGHGSTPTVEASRNRCDVVPIASTPRRLPPIAPVAPVRAEGLAEELARLDTSGAWSGRGRRTRSRQPEAVGLEDVDATDRPEAPEGETPEREATETSASRGPSPRVRPPSPSEPWAESPPRKRSRQPSRRRSCARLRPRRLPEPVSLADPDPAPEPELSGIEPREPSRRRPRSRAAAESEPALRRSPSSRLPTEPRSRTRPRGPPRRRVIELGTELARRHR